MGRNLRNASLRAFCGAMAAACALASLAMAFVMIGSFVAVTYAMTTGQNFQWNRTAPSASVSVQGQSTTCAKGATTCETTPLKAFPVEAVAPSIVGFTVAFLPGAVLAYGLAEACLCFFAFARGRYLQRRTTAQLARFAVAGLFFVVTAPMAGALAKGAGELTIKAIALASRDGGETTAQFTAFTTTFTGANGLLIGLYAVTLTVIALIMARAATIAEDHAQIV
ncbi:hypothetical protein [Caulobacter endophyticus]|uniref:DUF2975 domain-containing protein n=1 Tax=Caulobacter endophyticus TaxID=2172652 RepID=A0A2T9K7P7_9CAUL|nr:hypothetical protein [Caulobacter endophyticus]PVM91903.1 hypothetical protein DDF67_06630 [Caulobacter endophyticus]